MDYYAEGSGPWSNYYEDPAVREARERAARERKARRMRLRAERKAKKEKAAAGIPSQS